MRLAIISLGLLLHGVASLPTPDSANQQQKVNTSPAFSLVAKVIRSSLGVDVNNRVLVGVHSGAGQSLQTLVQGDPKSAGAYYVNGTMTGTEPAKRKNNDTTLSVGTGNLPPLGMKIDPDAGDGKHFVEVDFGYGSPGIYIRYGGPKAAKPYPHLVGMDDKHGQFFTCNQTLYDPAQPVQALLWRNASTPMPNGCADIELIPQCLGSVTNNTQSTQYLQPASCYDDALSFQLKHKA